MVAVALMRQRYVDKDNSYGRQIVGWNRKASSGRSGVGLIPVGEGCKLASHLFQIRAANPDELMLSFNQREIFPGVDHRVNTEFPIYACAMGSCLHATVSAELLSLALRRRLSRADVEPVAATAKTHTA